MKNIIQKLYHSRGQDEYVRKITEELNELACAVSHYLDAKVTKHEVMEEIADVKLQLEKLELLLVGFNEDDHAHLQQQIYKLKISKTLNLENLI